MIVADASAIVDVLVRPDEVPDLAERLAGDGVLYAPHLIDLELLHAARRLVRIGELSHDRGRELWTDGQRMIARRYPHEGFGDRIWELRENITAYDAVYVALAELVDCPLITTDAPLANSPGHLAQIELFS